MRLYALAAGALARLIADRRDLWAYARESLKTAEEMKKARDDLYADAQVYKTPDAQHPLALQVENGIAHIPIVGELTPSADPCGAFSMQGETEYGFISAACAAADADESVERVVFDINSPGGYIGGLDMAAQAMAAINKPTEARVFDMAASAAYWLASQADKIVAMSPDAQVGSIGVAAEWYDDEKAMAAEGYEHRVFTSTDAPNKRPDYSSDEGKALMVKELDDLHSVFVSRVAEGRKVSAKKVNEDFGRGGVLIARDALKAGMIDDIVGVSIARKTESGVAGEKTRAESAVNQSGGQKMTLDEFKAANPGTLEAHDKELYESGIKAEQSRREKINALRGSNADGDKAVDEAIASGRSFEDVFPIIQGAINRGNSPAANGENPPDVPTRKPANGSGVGESTDGSNPVDETLMLQKAGLPADFLKGVK